MLTTLRPEMLGIGHVKHMIQIVKWGSVINPITIGLYEQKLTEQSSECPLSKQVLKSDGYSKSDDFKDCNGSPDSSFSYLSYLPSYVCHHT